MFKTAFLASLGAMLAVIAVVGVIIAVLWFVGVLTLIFKKD